MTLGRRRALPDQRPPGGTRRDLWGEGLLGGPKSKTPVGGRQGGAFNLPRLTVPPAPRARLSSTLFQLRVSQLACAPCHEPFHPPAPSNMPKESLSHLGQKQQLPRAVGPSHAAAVSNPSTALREGVTVLRPILMLRRLRLRAAAEVANC